jgi:hypothetical protein
MTKREPPAPTLSDLNKEGLWLSAKLLKRDQSSGEIRDWLIGAFRQTALGGDANLALGVKRGRGKPKAGADASKKLKFEAAAAFIEASTLPSMTRDWLVEAFRQIADGKDANEVLGVKRSRGKPRRADPHVDFKLMAAMSFIAAVMRPEPPADLTLIADDDEFDYGQGLSFDEAIDLATGSIEDGGLGYSEETLRHYWSNNPPLRSPTFRPPAVLLPKRP